MKKNTKKIIKGVAAAGVVIGGASVVQPADVVYAAELDEAGSLTANENSQLQDYESDSAGETSDANDVIASLTPDNGVVTESYGRMMTQAEEVPAEETEEAGTASEYWSEVISTSTSNSDSGELSESTVEYVSESEETSLEASESAVDSVSELEKASLSTSQSIVDSTIASMSAQESTAQSEYDSDSAAYEKDYGDLENELAAITNAKAAVADNPSEANRRALAEAIIRYDIAADNQSFTQST